MPTDLNNGDIRGGSIGLMMERIWTLPPECARPRAQQAAKTERFRGNPQACDVPTLLRARTGALLWAGFRCDGWECPDALLMMAELNWYLHSRVRWMINTGSGHVSWEPSDGNNVLFQTRIGVDF